MIEWGTTFGSHDSAIAVFRDNDIVYHKSTKDKFLSDDLITYCEEQWGIPEKVYYYERPLLKATRRFFAGQKPARQKLDFKYPIITTNHHYSHACYGFYTSPFDECVVLVIDAIGEWDTLTLWHAKDNELKKMKYFWQYPKSLGLFYAALTQAAGFKPNAEEHLLMQKSDEKKNDISLHEKISCLWREEFNFHQGVDLSMYNKENIAYYTQIIFEEILQQILNDIYNMSEYNGNLIYCGGCALNKKANRLIKGNLYIPKRPGDNGSSIGCVLARKKIKIKDYEEINS